jgi:uncharacterized membrane protein
MDDLLQQGIAACKSGERDEARRLLSAFLKQDVNSEAGWGWLFSVCDTDKDRVYCLKQIIRINPQNEKAVQFLGKYSLPEQPSQSPGLDEIPDREIKHDALARKVTRFLVIFQVSALIIGIILILLRLNAIAYGITFVSLVLLAAGLTWFYIRYRTESPHRRQTTPFAFISFLRHALASRGVVAAILAAVIVFSPIVLMAIMMVSDVIATDSLSAL